MKKILVVFTGGTIGSRIHQSTIDVDKEAGYHLIKSFQDNYGYAVDFDTVQPINFLSENFTPWHWKLLFDVIKQVDHSLYEGIIVTHGSDTLTYTSAVLSFLMGHTRIPIVLTASNYALGCTKSNGLTNFHSCVDFIIKAALPGVFTVFQNDKSRSIVYLASRIMEADPYNDQYLSFGGEYFGEINDSVFLPKKSKINPTLENILEHRACLIDDIAFSNQIMAMRVYPGLDYNILKFKKKPKAILHSLYHSGTACTDASDCSLSAFIKQCREDGIDSYLISFKNIDNDLYRTSRELLDYGAIPLQNISFEAAYVKLCIAYNQTSMKPLEYIEKELFF